MDPIAHGLKKPAAIAPITANTDLSAVLLTLPLCVVRQQYRRVVADSVGYGVHRDTAVEQQGGESAADMMKPKISEAEPLRPSRKLLAEIAPLRSVPGSRETSLRDCVKMSGIAAELMLNAQVENYQLRFAVFHTTEMLSGLEKEYDARWHGEARAHEAPAPIAPEAQPPAAGEPPQETFSTVIHSPAALPAWQHRASMGRPQGTAPYVGSQP